MPLLARLLLAFSLLLPLAPAMAQQQSQAVHPFAHQGVKEDATRYETYLKSNWKLSGKPGAELRRDGERMLRVDPRAASRSFAGAVVADSKDADAWIGLARALLAITPDPNKGSERYDLPVNASGAAYIGYERAQGDAAEGARARRARRRAAAALLLAPGHRCAEDEPRARRQRRRCARPTTSCAPSTASAWSTTRPSRRRPPRACACSSPKRSPAARSTSPSSSPSTARTRRASRPRTSSSASTALRTASATRCRCAPACRRPSRRS